MTISHSFFNHSSRFYNQSVANKVFYKIIYNIITVTCILQSYKALYNHSSGRKWYWLWRLRQESLRFVGGSRNEKRNGIYSRAEPDSQPSTKELACLLCSLSPSYLEDPPPPRQLSRDNKKQKRTENSADIYVYTG